MEEGLTNTMREKEGMCERNNLKATSRHVLPGSVRQNYSTAMETRKVNQTCFYKQAHESNHLSK